MDKQYTVEEINRGIEFIESVLQGIDKMIKSGTYPSREINVLYQRRKQTLMLLNQWKSRLSGEKDKPNEPR